MKYTDEYGDRVPVESIEVGLGQEQAEFADWLQEKLPEVDVIVGTSTGNYINGLWTWDSPEASDCMNALWAAYCNSV